MHKKPDHAWWLWLFFLVAGSGVSRAQEINWALGRRYELAPNPNYPLCTDPADATQLTDGQQTGADWRKKSTVGWRVGGEIPFILVDLDAPRTVDRLRIHTVGGGRSGVFFPTYLWVGASEDGSEFAPFGWANTLDRPQDRTRSPAAPRMSEVIEITGRSTQARYVMVAFEAGSDFIFLDEVEVLGRSTEAGPPSELVRFTRNQLPDVLRLVRTRSLIESDLLATAAQVASNLRTPDTLALDDLRRRLSGLSLGDGPGTEALRRDLNMVRGSLLKAKTETPWVAWMANPMDSVSPTDFRSLGKKVAGTLEMNCWQGEFESGAVNIANTSSRELLIRADVSAIQTASGAVVEPTDYATLRYAVHLHARAVGRTADALALLTDQGFRLAPGVTGQIWLTINADSVPAGTYDLALRIFAAEPAAWISVRPELVPIKLEVHPLQLPENLAVSSYNWAYVGHVAGLRAHPDEVLRDLRSHYTDTLITHPSTLPRPDEAGGADYSAIGQELARYQEAKTVLLFWGLGKQNRSLSSLGKVGSPEWKTQTTRWLKNWIEHLKAAGWTYDRFVMYPYDEYIGPEYYELARLIKESVDPNVRLFANARGEGGDFERIRPYIDIWCLPDAHASGKSEAPRSTSDVMSWTYAADGPGKANPAYSYYRLQPWRAFARGDTGCGFWAYSDPKSPDGASAWDDYSKPQGWYSVVYGTDGTPDGVLGEVIIPSRRWEAWREGLEDYQYLFMLQSEIEEARRRGAPSKLVREAERQLNQSIANVLSHPNEANTVYQERKLLTRSIIELRSAR